MGEAAARRAGAQSRAQPEACILHSMAGEHGRAPARARLGGAHPKKKTSERRVRHQVPIEAHVARGRDALAGRRRLGALVEVRLEVHVRGREVPGRDAPRVRTCRDDGGRKRGAGLRARDRNRDVLHEVEAAARLRDREASDVSVTVEMAPLTPALLACCATSTLMGNAASGASITTPAAFATAFPGTVCSGMS